LRPKQKLRAYIAIIYLLFHRDKAAKLILKEAAAELTLLQQQQQLILFGDSFSYCYTAAAAAAPAGSMLVTLSTLMMLGGHNHHFTFWISDRDRPRVYGPTGYDLGMGANYNLNISLTHARIPDLFYCCFLFFQMS